MTIEVTWLGHSTWWIETGEAKILSDPFIGDNPAAKVASTSLIPTHILISHGHYDHMADAAKGIGTEVALPYNLYYTGDTALFSDLKLIARNGLVNTVLRLESNA